MSKGHALSKRDVPKCSFSGQIVLDLDGRTVCSVLARAFMIFMMEKTLRITEWGTGGA